MEIIKLREKSVKITVILLMVVTIFFSGCIVYPPKSDLEKYIVRIYDDTDEFSLISIVENYDFLDSIPLEENDSRVFSEFGYGLTPHDSFVQNISDFLASAKSHYDSHEGLFLGELYYVIECANSSSSSLSDVLQLVKQLQESQKSQNLSFKWQYPISDSYNFAAYHLPNNSTMQIKSDKQIISYSESLLSNIKITNLTWTILIDIRYNWTGKNETCMGYEFTELILLTSDFKVISFFSQAGGRIC